MISEEIINLTNEVVDGIINDIKRVSSKLFIKHSDSLYYPSSNFPLKKDFDSLVNENLNNIGNVYVDFDLIYLEKIKNTPRFCKDFYIVSRYYDELNLERIFNHINEVYNRTTKKELENFHKNEEKNIIKLSINFTLRVIFVNSIKINNRSIFESAIKIVKLYKIEDMF